MKTLTLLSCVIGMALCVPVVKRDTQTSADVPSPISAEAAAHSEAARRKRLIEIDVFNVGYGGYDGFGFGGPGYGGYGGYGGFPGYGGFGGYPGYGYGGFGGYPDFGYGGFF